MLTESCGLSSDEHVDSKQGTLRSKRTELEHVSEHLRARAPIQDSDNSWHLGKETLPLVSSDHVVGTLYDAKHVERTMSAELVPLAEHLRADAPVADCGNPGHEEKQSMPLVSSVHLPDTFCDTKHVKRTVSCAQSTERIVFIPEAHWKPNEHGNYQKLIVPLMRALKSLGCKAFEPQPRFVRKLQPIPSNGMVRLLLSFSSVEQVEKACTALDQLKIDHVASSPPPITGIMGPIPNGMSTDDLQLHCVGECSGIKVTVLYHRETGTHMKKARFVVPADQRQQIFNILPLENRLHFRALVYSSTRCCNMCWSPGHSRQSCKLKSELCALCFTPGHRSTHCQSNKTPCCKLCQKEHLTFKCLKYRATVSSKELTPDPNDANVFPTSKDMKQAQPQRPSVWKTAPPQQRTHAASESTTVSETTTVLGCFLCLSELADPVNGRTTTEISFVFLGSSQ